MRILLTGATGLLGAQIGRALAGAGHELRCLVRRPGATLPPGSVPARGDLSDPGSVARAVGGVEAVVHAAGLVSYRARDAGALRRVNVEGTRTLLRASLAAGVRRFLLTSSIATLGWVPEGEIGDEGTAFNWQGLDIAYFETKAAAEAMVLAEAGIEGVAVNPGITFGPGRPDHPSLVLLSRIARGRMPGFPPGATTAATIRDVVAGHLAALDRGRPGERYVLGGYPCTFAELYERIAKALGVPPPTRRIPPGRLRLAARVSEAVSLLSGRPPLLTTRLAEIAIRNRRYGSRKAREELGYTVSPLEECARAAWRSARTRR